MIKLIKIWNIKNFYNSREKVIKLYDGYANTISEARHKAKYVGRRKILAPKQMLQILPIALAQLKADSNLENLLNVIRQICYSLYQNKLLKKYSIT